MAGQLAGAQARASMNRARFEHISPEWADRFRIQEARVRHYQGQSSEAVRLLNIDKIWGRGDSELATDRLIILSLATARLGNHAQAEQYMAHAEKLSDEGQRTPSLRVQGEILAAQGSLSLENGSLSEAQNRFETALNTARQSSDKYLEASMLLNLCVVALEQEHYEDALERSAAASAVARSIGAQQLLEKTLGNVGWAYYLTGDFERAFQNSDEAAKQAALLGAITDQVIFLNNSGLSEYRLGNLSAAESFYKRSLKLAGSLQNDERVGDADVALASLLLRSGQPAAASPYIREAKRLAAKRKSAFDELTPLLLEAQLTVQQGDKAAARATLLNVNRHSREWPSLRWEAQRSLARLSDETGDSKSAGIWFQRSIATFREQRSSLRSDDIKLPFFANGRDLYLDYVDYLVRNHSTNAALETLDQGRAETLAEGLGIEQSNGVSYARTAPDARSIARRLQGTILVYSLAPQTSYLWAVTGSRTSLYQLPGKAEILGLVANHRQVLLAARDILNEHHSAAQALYNELVKPAQELIEPDGKVFIIADEGLHGLNFETLLTPGANSHYWIEDVTITNAASLRLLALSHPSGAARTHATPAKRLLVIGDPNYAGQQYARLTNAAAEVSDVAANFASGSRTLLTGDQASPAAYMSSKPEGFDYIHFVAHAVASETTPLDSAVILSSKQNSPDSAKLYAHEILNRPLHAQLVTLSACQGSGIRAYAGEGLVGLAWAFLRAGSHNVIGALWDVSDASTPQLMEDLYRGLAAGRQPDAALRSAKLAMLHSRGVFRKPIYWAAFQLYSTG